MQALRVAGIEGDEAKRLLVNALDDKVRANLSSVIARALYDYPDINTSKLAELTFDQRWNLITFD